MKSRLEYIYGPGPAPLRLNIYIANIFVNLSAQSPDELYVSKHVLELELLYNYKLIVNNLSVCYIYLI